MLIANECLESRLKAGSAGTPRVISSANLILRSIPPCELGLFFLLSKSGFGTK